MSYEVYKRQRLSFRKLGKWARRNHRNLYISAELRLDLGPIVDLMWDRESGRIGIRASQNGNGHKVARTGGISASGLFKKVGISEHQEFIARWNDTDKLYELEPILLKDEQA